MYCGLSGLRRRNEAFSLYEDEDERLWCRIPKGMLSLRRLYTSHFAIPTALLYGWLPLSSPAGASQATTRDVVQPPSLPPFPGGQKHPRCREAYYADVCTEISNTFLSRARRPRPRIQQIEHPTSETGINESTSGLNKSIFSKCRFACSDACGMGNCIFFPKGYQTV